MFIDNVLKLRNIIESFCMSAVTNVPRFVIPLLVILSGSMD